MELVITDQLTWAPFVFCAAIGQQVKFADGDAPPVSWVDSLAASSLVRSKEAFR